MQSKLLKKVVLLLTICFGVLFLSNQPAKADNAQQQAVVTWAEKQVGKSYVWGAKGPNSFDCSGLVQYVYQNALGMSVPVPTTTQQNYGWSVSLNDLQPGDLIFWGNPAWHVGIYVGNGEYVGAQNPNEGVVKTKIDYTYFAPSFARRLITPGPTFPMKPIDMSVATVKFVSGYGINAYDSDGNYIDGSRDIFMNGTAWKVGEQRMINGQEMLQVATNEWIPRQYTNLDASVITVNAIPGGGVNTYDLNGNFTGTVLTSGTQWKSDQFATINGKRMYRVATNMYIPEQWTQFGPGK